MKLPAVARGHWEGPPATSFEACRHPRDTARSRRGPAGFERRESGAIPAASGSKRLRSRVRHAEHEFAGGALPVSSRLRDGRLRAFGPPLFSAFSAISAFSALFAPILRTISPMNGRPRSRVLI